METISLEDLLRRRFKTTAALPGPALEQVNQIRERELRFNRWLPQFLVRRISRAFARSNTVHPSTARALYALTRALRPSVVFETGTYWGYATSYLAAAVADNGSGRVWSFDLYAQAGKHLADFLRPQVDLVRGRPSVETLPEVLARVQPQLFFQDSLHDYEGVLSELQIVRPSMGAGTMVLFHDFVADGVRRAAQDGLPGWHVFQLDLDDPQQLGVALAPGSLPAA